jgi:NAD(P)-dependent dehydrogenase (short-subunit alcohol dehydrogenase family)
MDFGLRDKVIVVAGGNKGFGAASARRLAQEGAKLFLVARNEHELGATAREIRQNFGVEVATGSFDLLVPENSEAAAKAALASYGRIDGLVCSVGASGGGLFWEIPDKVWHDSFALKFMANTRMMRAVLPTMRKQRYGRIVVIVGQFGKQPHRRVLPGSAANAALLSVVKGVADEVAAEGITINAVNPGPSRTERWNRLMSNLAKDAGRSVQELESEFERETPMGRLGDPDEIARHVCYLASDAAGYMTGASITADGGWVRSFV